MDKAAIPTGTQVEIAGFRSNNGEDAVTAIHVLIALCAATALGQMNTGEVSGTVKDQLEGLPPAATIVAEHTGTGQKTAPESTCFLSSLLDHTPSEQRRRVSSNPRCPKLKFISVKSSATTLRFS